METCTVKNKFCDAAKVGVFGKHEPGGAMWTLQSAVESYIVVRENKLARE